MLFRIFSLVLTGLFFVFTPLVNSAQETLTLEKALDLTMTRQVQILQSDLSREIAGGRLVSAGAAFDTQFRASADYLNTNNPLTSSQEKATGFSTADSVRQDYRLELSKTLRSGLNLNSYLTLGRQKDKTYALLDTNSRSLGLTLSMPYYDLVGNNSFSLREEAAREMLREALFNHYHQVAISLYRTTLAWWDFLAAKQRLWIYKLSVEKTEKSLHDYRKLIAAGERPQSDINQIEAKHVSMQTQYSAAFKSFEATGYQLTRVIGIPYERRWLGAFENGSGKFSFQSKTVDIEPLLQRLFERRFDILAAQSLVKSATLQLDAAQRDEKSDLDIYVTVEGSQQAANLWSKNNSDNSGSKILAGVHFSKFFENSLAKGVLIEQHSRLRQAEIRLKELKRTLEIDLLAAGDDLKRSIDTEEFAEKTVKLYKHALKFEKKKFSMGMSTILDVIATFDSLRNALLTQVSSRAELARALTTLKYAAGKMVNIESGKIVVNLENNE